MDSGSCTANFVFTSPDNATVYIGTAAHCFSTSGSLATNGCEAGTKPLGTTMQVQGASVPATLVYSSWVAMHEAKETDQSACSYNDFALLLLHPSDHAKVNPAMKQYGGPTGLVDPASIRQLDKVLTYGNSALRVFADTPSSPREGYVAFAPGSGWTMDIYTVGPGVPGDSGSAVGFADSVESCL